MLLHELVLSEPGPAEDENAHPGQSARHIVGQELAVAHPADAGDKWREGPHDGNKAGQDDRLAPIFLEEPVRALEILLLQEANLARKGPRANVAADPVIDVVPDNGGR